MSDLIHFSDSTFETEVLNATQPVLVDFTAAWCGPCRMLDPVVEQLADELGGKLRVGKLDIDENPEITLKYQVMGVPTLILFVNGQQKERLMGYMPKHKIEAKLKAHLN